MFDRCLPSAYKGQGKLLHIFTKGLVLYQLIR